MPLNRYRNSSFGVWTRKKNLRFNYSDGDEVENRLLKQVQEAKDVSLASDELQRLIIDWPSEYHFSPLRANLLSSFNLKQFTNILEIGSGCGAMTRLMGEQCPDANIIALEGSGRRAIITRARCRDLSNVKVYHDSFSGFAHDGPFDLITMIGVLEYSPSYFKGNKPIFEALNRARRLLSQNGILVVAIENQLGLKYFNGCSEDHNGNVFSGLNDLYTPGTIRTFGKKELQEKIKEAGFKRMEFFYPFPDYKLPRLMLREESFLCGELDLSHLVGQFPARDYGKDGDKIFHEARVWNLLSRNGLIREMSNSFLIFAFADNKAMNEITDQWLAKAFSSQRKKKYLIETVFCKQQDEIIVEKKASYPFEHDQSADDTENLIHHIGKADYIKGVPYGYFLPEKVSGEDSREKFISYLAPWVEWLRKKTFIPSTPEEKKRLMISGGLYDCMPANLLINQQNQICLIDQEWEYRESLELGFVMFRGIYRELFESIEIFEQTDLFEDGTIYDLFKQIYNRFDLPFNQDIFKKYIDLEIVIQVELVPYNTGKKDLKNYMESFFRVSRERKSALSDLLNTGGVRRYSLLLWQVKMLEQALAEREEHISKLNQIVAERDDLLSSVFESKSWRLTAPLRFAGSVIKGDFNNKT